MSCFGRGDSLDPITRNLQKNSNKLDIDLSHKLFWGISATRIVGTVPALGILSTVELYL